MAYFDINDRFNATGSKIARIVEMQTSGVEHFPGSFCLLFSYLLFLFNVAPYLLTYPQHRCMGSVYLQKLSHTSISQFDKSIKLPETQNTIKTTQLH